jgi:hypothetical protein
MTTSFYDDGKYGVISRKWFGLTTKLGGDVQTTGLYTIASATAITHLARWYPKGPINIIKCGLRVLATLSTGATANQTEILPVRFYKSSAAGASMNTLIDSFSCYVGDHTSNPGQYGIASGGKALSSPEVEAGRYITIRTGTTTTAGGTESTVGTVDGTVAFFIDWVPRFDMGGAWD